MIYLVFLLQVILVLGVVFMLLSGQNKLFHLFPKEKDSGAATAFTKEELMNWQNTLATMLQETETLSMELTVKISKSIEELEGKIQLAAEKIREIKELLPGEVSPAQTQLIPSIVVKPLRAEEQMAIPGNPRHTKIFELADQGWNITDIAKEAKVGRGEIQLILGLRREEKAS